MDFVTSHFSSMSHDVLNLRGLKHTLFEYVTPHKICVVILIQEYCQLKTKLRKDEPSGSSLVLHKYEMNPLYRKDFCMLMLHLIQGPDLNFDEFNKLLSSPKYQLFPDLIKNFRKQVVSLVHREVGGIMNVLIFIERLLIEPNSYEPIIINKSSKMGLFLRRVRLYFDKLSFSQTIAMFQAFRSYVLSTKDANFQLEKEEADEEEASMDMELSSNNQLSPSALPEPQIRHPPEKGIDPGDEGEAQIGLWSRRQAELFIANQAKFLTNQPLNALPPQTLQTKIREVLAANPEHAEAHYLSYLNCMRSKEFCGAVDSIFHYFDRKASGLYEEDSSRYKGLRFAALNLAILRAKFGHKKEALTALKEAITLSHEANDNVCLQHAQAWMYQLQQENVDILMERSLSKSNELNLNYLSSFGLLSYAQFAARNGGLPSHIFELLSKSDVLNCQYSMTELLSLGFVHKAALWSLYGQSDLAVLASQQLLYLPSSHSSSSNHSGEAIILAICNIANYLTMQGKYRLAWVLINHGKKRVPDSKWWVWAENNMYFNESLHRGYWVHCEIAVQQMATVDKFESMIKMCQLHLAKGNRREGLVLAQKIMETSDCPMMRIRAVLMAAKCNPMASILDLCEAYHVSNFHSIHYFMRLIALEMANTQLEMGLSCQAWQLVDQNLINVFSHGSYPDMADGLILYAKCKVATVATAPPPKKVEVILDAIKILNKASEYSKAISDFLRVKKIVYLKALLYGSISMDNERNKCAFEFRTMDEHQTTSDAPSASSSSIP